MLFAETTTIGVRSHAVTRLKVARRVEEVATPYGPIAVKIAGGDGTPELIAPEYESCRAAAARADVPLRVVYDAARAAARAGLRRPRSAGTTEYGTRGLVGSRSARISASTVRRSLRRRRARTS